MTSSPPSAHGPDARPEGLQDFVLRRLSRDIVSGELPPGARLSPARLAEQLGVSHIPVREALVALEEIGHVRRVPRIGFFVAELSLEDLEDIYHWRQVLEDEAHRLAIPLLTESDLQQMRDLNRDMAKAVRESGQTFLALNQRFHFIPFERSGSERLVRFLTRLWHNSSRYQNAMAYVKVPRSLAQDHHREIMRAFEARDVERVNDWMDRHRRITLEKTRELHDRGKDPHS
ncbi:MAG: GntR family transcriptional regulator [Geodermatophilaceae bacterium]|nr:GntR family transcriptional regulator [Geodermatophilaceae bacterium]